MLAAVGVDGHVAGPEGRRWVVDRKFHQPASRRHACRRRNADDAVDALDHTAGLVMVWRPKMSDVPSAACRPVQKALVKRVSLSETSTSGSHTSRNTNATKLRAAVSTVAVLKVGTSHTRPVRRYLQKVVAKAGDGQLVKVQADTPAASGPVGGVAGLPVGASVSVETKGETVEGTVKSLLTPTMSYTAYFSRHHQVPSC